MHPDARTGTFYYILVYKYLDLDIFLHTEHVLKSSGHQWPKFETSPKLHSHPSSSIGTYLLTYTYGKKAAQPPIKKFLAKQLVRSVSYLRRDGRVARRKQYSEKKNFFLKIAATVIDF